nr:transposase domain-containing protein [Sporolactobacillus pectinivorans]
MLRIIRLRKGAEASAIVYSIIETAKENGLRPFHYLSYLFEQLPKLERVTEETLDSLLPWSKAIPSECRLSTKA